MKVDTDIPLSSLTTLRVGGPARFVHTIRSVDDLRDLFLSSEIHGDPWVVLGEGSNVLADDRGFDGHVLLMRIQGQTIVREDDTEIHVRVGAGESWDVFVEATVSQGLWGAENLSGIPGTVGATPIQNVAAYGVEVKNIIETIEAFDTTTRTIRMLTREECAFGYRDSFFKSEEGKALIVTAIVFRLFKSGTPSIGYLDLMEYFTSRGNTNPTLAEIRTAVLEIRSKKFPDLTRVGTAGSFFKNPILSEEAFGELRARFPDIPSYPATKGQIKIPVAWILDHVLGMRGYRAGTVGFFEHHALVLVAYEGATAHEIDSFANDIVRRVHDATGVVVEREVRALK